MVVHIVKETTMKRHRVLQPHVQVSIRIECLFSSFCLDNMAKFCYYSYVIFMDTNERKGLRKILI